MPAPLIVTDPRASVRSSGQSFTVTAEDDTGRRETLLEVEAINISLIVLCGGAHITSPAVDLALGNGIDVSMVRRNGDFLGRICGPLSLTPDLRIAQVRAFTDPAEALNRAKATVAAKLASAVAVLDDHRDSLPGNEPLADARRSVEEAARRFAEAPTVDVLLGHEGEGAAAYFGGLRHIFRRGIRFEGRRSRPAPDPADAVLMSGCDKLSNLRSIRDDLEQVGVTLFGRFKGGMDGTLWYYGRVTDIFLAAGGALGPRLSPELGAVRSMVAGRPG